jgi:hypothetical protein
VSSPGLACPCCGSLTLPSHGTFDICPVCFWEDDFTSGPDDDLNPNNLTLREARANLAVWGAIESHLVHSTRPPQPGEAPEGTPHLGERPYDRWPTAIDFPGGVRLGWIGPPAPARWWRRQAFVVLADGRRAGLTATADALPGAPPSVVSGELVGRDRVGQFDLHLPGPRCTDDDALTALREGLIDVLLAGLPATAQSRDP